MNTSPDSAKENASFQAAMAERAKMNKAVAAMATDLAKAAVGLKKAKSEGEAAKKELAGESDEI